MAKWWLIGVFGVVVIQRLIELGVAKRNATWIKEQGGVEHSPEHYPWIVALHVSWFIAWPLEAFLRGPDIVVWWWTPFMFLIFGQMLRYGALFSLGKHWNTRIFVIPGEKPVSKGLYNIIPHPNYVAVAIELACFPLLFQAKYTAVAATAVNAFLLLRIRIPAENKALATLEQVEQTS